MSMKTVACLSAVLAILAVSPAPAGEVLATTVKGDPGLQSIEALAFAPDGILLIGDGMEKRSHRLMSGLWRKEEVKVPIWKRLAMIVKLRPSKRLGAKVNTDRVYPEGDDLTPVTGIANIDKVIAHTPNWNGAILSWFLFYMHDVTQDRAAVLGAMLDYIAEREHAFRVFAVCHHVNLCLRVKMFPLRSGLND